MPRSQSINILLTGRPGIGKTTVVKRVQELLSNRHLAGFYTEEIRTGRQRQGFRIVTMSGDTGTLADVRVKSNQRVGRYGVDVAAFETLVLPELVKPCNLMLIDEIGKMECFSSSFIAAVRALLDAKPAIIATIAGLGTGFIEEVKARTDVELIEVTRENRNELPGWLADRLSR